MGTNAFIKHKFWYTYIEDEVTIQERIKTVECSNTTRIIEEQLKSLFLYASTSSSPLLLPSTIENKISCENYN